MFFCKITLRELLMYCCTESYKNTFSGDPKVAAKFDLLGDRHKRYFERVEKVHFWKIQFQNLLQKSKNSNFAAIFVYMGYMDGTDFVENGIGKWRPKKIFLRSDPSGPRSTYYKSI